MRLVVPMSSLFYVLYFAQFALWYWPNNKYATYLENFSTIAEVITWLLVPCVVAFWALVVFGKNKIKKHLGKGTAQAVLIKQNKWYRVVWRNTNRILSYSAAAFIGIARADFSLCFVLLLIDTLGLSFYVTTIGMYKEILNGEQK